MMDTPVIPDSAPFSGDQKAWINGYLAGLIAAGALRLPGVPTPSSAIASPVETSGLRVLILYGSQTGTTEACARKVAKAARQKGLQPEVVGMEAHAKIRWTEQKYLLLMTSTYGDGEMPDNAQEFWNFLRSDAAPSLEGLSYSVLALGDRNYPQFCQAGKNFDQRLTTLGARCLHPRQECDVDYESDMEKWMTAVLAQVASLSPSGSVVALPASTPVAEALPMTPAWSKKNPYPATLAVNRLLTAEGSGKETRHFEVDLGDSGLTYLAGDALGVQPSNDPVLVDELMALLGFPPDQTVASPDGNQDGTLRDILLHAADITKPSKELIQFIAEKSGSDQLRRLTEPEHAAALKDYLWGRGVIHLVESHPGVFGSVKEFVSLLRKLQPRLYSIASSPRKHARQVHLTVATVRYQSHGRSIGGVCSTFLADRAGKPRVKVPVFVHASPGFRPPADPSAPMIMVGPGTGVAPFRAFLQDRQAAAARGKNWLFFGEQKSATDFFYREEFEQFVRDGFLTRLSTAFSRDQEHKIYVQHRMIEEAAEVWRWLEEGAYFYVCGDAARMAKDVDAALHEVCEKAGGLSVDNARDYVARLKKEKRYCRDVY